MISIRGLNANLECSEPNCGDALAVKLVLTMAGTLAPWGIPATWQVLGNPKAPLGPYICRCPKHVQKIERPVIQGVRIEGH